MNWVDGLNEMDLPFVRLEILWNYFRIWSCWDSIYDGKTTKAHECIHWKTNDISQNDQFCVWTSFWVMDHHLNDKVMNSKGTHQYGWIIGIVLTKCRYLCRSWWSTCLCPCQKYNVRHDADDSIGQYFFTQIESF